MSAVPTPVEESSTAPELTTDQAKALRKIESAYEPGEFYLLTGHAGSGKTYLMQRLTKNMLAKKFRIVLSAPTHRQSRSSRANWPGQHQGRTMPHDP